MIGTTWASVILVSGLLSLLLGAYLASGTGVVLGVCFTVMGAGIIWHEGRFSPRRMKR